MGFVERDDVVDALCLRLDEAVTGRGNLAWITGEPGMGKTTVVDAFLRSLPPEVRALAGACDGLSTPRPLGPVVDMAARAEDVAALLDRDRQGLLSGFLDVLSTPGRPTVVVFEDVHWADESTLDLLRYLGRRVHRTHAVVLATFRPEEVVADHPLRPVLGGLATSPGVSRLPLTPLTVAGVAELAHDTDLDPTELHERTGGNPFFVTEVLANPTAAIPASVRDVVLARRQLLTPAGRSALDAVSAMPGSMEVAVARHVLGPDAHGVDECVEVGMLEAHRDGGVSFRHELARMAVSEAIAPARSQQLHASVCEALLAADDPDPSRIAHHADLSQDAELVLRYGREAAARAAQVGAHRQAAAHLRRVLRYADPLPDNERAGLLEALAQEAMTDRNVREATEAATAAVAMRRDLRGVQQLGSALTLLAQARAGSGLSELAHEAALEAIRLLEAEPPTAALAKALSVAARLKMLARDHDGALEYGARAIELAEATGDMSALSSALNAVGATRILAGDITGEDDLIRSFDVAHDAGLDVRASASLLNLGSGFGEVREYERAERYLRQSIDYSEARDQDQAVDYATAWLARVLFETGMWDEAGDLAAGMALDRPEAPPLPAMVGLTVLGRLRSRRGDPGADAALDRAWELAVASNDLQRLWPAAAGRAEAAALRGNDDSVPDLVDSALELARRIGHPWAIGELSLALRRSGYEPGPYDRAAEPYRLHLDGDIAGAAGAWRKLGCPFEEAVALSDGDEDQQRRSLEILDELGATPVAGQLRQRMRDAGVRAVPRGPRPATASHPLGLTARQAAVLELIAERLFLSEKTVGHHVSAILSKLDVPSRTEAAGRYREALDDAGDRS